MSDRLITKHLDVQPTKPTYPVQPTESSSAHGTFSSGVGKTCCNVQIHEKFHESFPLYLKVTPSTYVHK